ncbi:hypothetical protein PanWU01x14_147450 [Parasponia andersonii]|uniref:PGG domain containing protein n=1 Tax=Parasponia andersonii TaxID=3476 RepID=A0A2P5CJI4_PARAD|nr:hypothetical protein PanWU01x14_147450 [Parasponia andersonii]
MMKALHNLILSANSLLGVFLQLLYQQKKDASPFETHYATMISIFVSLCLYVLAATVAHAGLPHPPEAAVLTISNAQNYAGIMNQISLFAGFLAAVLQFTILVPPFGWLTFALWMLCFVKFPFHLLCNNLFPRLLPLLVHVWIKATSGEGVVPQNRLRQRRRPPV